jgi:hypothetical protein
VNSNLAFGAAGVILGALLYHFLIAPETESSVETVYKTEIKTEWIKKDTTIFHLKDSLVFRVIETKASDKPEKYDSLRTYSGKTDFDFGAVNWTAKTGGELQFLKFNTAFNIPIKTITNTVEKTTTIVQKPKGLYFTGGVRSDQDFAAGAMYLKNNSVISYDYFLQSQTHFLKVGFNPFKK